MPLTLTYWLIFLSLLFELPHASSKVRPKERWLCLCTLLGDSKQHFVKILCFLGPTSHLSKQWLLKNAMDFIVKKLTLLFTALSRPQVPMWHLLAFAECGSVLSPDLMAPTPTDPLDGLYAQLCKSWLKHLYPSWPLNSAGVGDWPTAQ